MKVQQKFLFSLESDLGGMSGSWADPGLLYKVNFISFGMLYSKNHLKKESLRILKYLK